MVDIKFKVDDTNMERATKREKLILMKKHQDNHAHQTKCIIQCFEDGTRTHPVVTVSSCGGLQIAMVVPISKSHGMF